MRTEERTGRAQDGIERPCSPVQNSVRDRRCGASDVVIDVFFERTLQREDETAMDSLPTRCILRHSNSAKSVIGCSTRVGCSSSQSRSHLSPSSTRIGMLPTRLNWTAKHSMFVSLTAAHNVGVERAAFLHLLQM